MADDTKKLEKWEAEQLIDLKVRNAINENNVIRDKFIDTMFTIKLSKFESAYSVGKFIAVAVGLLVIGTLYQLFITLARSGVVK